MCDHHQEGGDQCGKDAAQDDQGHHPPVVERDFKEKKKYEKVNGLKESKHRKNCECCPLSLLNVG